MKKQYLIYIIAIVAVIGGLFWYLLQKKAEVSETSEEAAAAVEVKDGLGAEVFKKSNNPLSNELPETNPFQVNTNPFK